MTDGAFWVAVTQSEAKLLQDYAIGNSEGGPSTAQNTWTAIRTLTDHSSQVLRMYNSTNPLILPASVTISWLPPAAVDADIGTLES